MTEEKLLSVNNLSVTYGKATVVKNVSLEVKPGEIVLLLGRNGAGKTTTLSAISGLIPKISGTIHFEGNDISKKSPLNICRAGISNVLQGHRVFGDLSVEDNLKLGGYGILKGTKLSKRINEMYELFPLMHEHRDKKAGRLSGGQQQILSVAQGLIPAPKLLFLDEPSIGVAPLIVNEILGILESLKSEGMAVLLVEQLVHQALTVANHVYVIDNGSIVGEGTPDELKNNGLIERVYLGA